MAAKRYAKYVYAPKPGDEVKWSNGLTMTCNDEGTLVVVGVPDGHILWVDSLDRTRGIFGVRVK